MLRSCSCYFDAYALGSRALRCQEHVELASDAMSARGSVLEPDRAAAVHMVGICAALRGAWDLHSMRCLPPLCE